MTIQVETGLELAIGKLSGALDRHSHTTRQQVEAMKATTPVDVRFQVNVTSGASGDAVMVLPGPDTGFYWHVRRLVIGGNTWSTAVNGSAEVYVTGVAATTYVNIRDLADMADQASSLPNKAFYGEHELIIQPGENLVIVIHSPTGTTLYKASVQIQQFRTLPQGIDFTG